MSPIIVIFLVVLFLYLLSEYSSILVLQFLKLCFGDTSYDKRKKLELSAYLAEQKGISMVDEFPKYARLDRKINNIKGILKSRGQEKSEKIVLGRLILGYLFSLFQWIAFFVFLYIYRSEPVIQVNPKWTYPISDLLSFPEATAGVISGATWIIICRTTVTQLSSIIKSKLF